MALKHQVTDTDNNFSINPTTRIIKNESPGKNYLIQYDHNSEVFSFEVPKVVEGHDLSKCDHIEIHYVNIDGKTQMTSSGVYEVTDYKVSDQDPTMLIFSWLISHHATKYVGSLNFLVRFYCVGDQGDLCYVWNTAVHSDIKISSGLCNSDTIVEEYADVLAKWRAELQGFKFLDLQQTKSSTFSKGENVWTATFDDGTPQGFSRQITVLNGEKGEIGPPGESAYDVAKRLGLFTGTEEDFIGSLIYPEFYLDGVRLKNVKFSVTGDTLTIETVT